MIKDHWCAFRLVVVLMVSLTVKVNESFQLGFGLTQNVAQQPTNGYCRTPLDQNGQCVSLRFCPEVVNLFRYLHANIAKQYSAHLQRSCGNRITFDNYPLVSNYDFHNVYSFVYSFVYLFVYLFVYSAKLCCV